MSAVGSGIVALMAEQTSRVPLVVAAAIIYHGRVLAAQRSSPPELAGQWEFPGGKVEAGETEPEALMRECQEEIGVTITPQRLLGEVGSPFGHGRIRLWSAVLTDPASARPVALEHLELRWLGAQDLSSVAWLPGNRQFEDAVRPLLR